MSASWRVWTQQSQRVPSVYTLEVRDDPDWRWERTASPLDSISFLRNAITEGEPRLVCAEAQYFVCEDRMRMRFSFIFFFIFLGHVWTFLDFWDNFFPHSWHLQILQILPLENRVMAQSMAQPMAQSRRRRVQHPSWFNWGGKPKQSVTWSQDVVDWARNWGTDGPTNGWVIFSTQQISGSQKLQNLSQPLWTIILRIKHHVISRELPDTPIWSNSPKPVLVDLWLSGNVL